MTETPVLRSNARRNRDRILEVAHEALTASADASLNSIAKAAGVGIATVYRHFPTREELVLAVYRMEVAQVVDLAPELLERSAPIDALRDWMLRVARYGMTKHGLAAAMGALRAGLADEARGKILGAIDLLLRACEQDGAIRPGVRADDFLLAMTGLFRMDAAGDWEQQARRLIDLLVAGLEAGAPRP
jgi:AcrR family transcriptional regulator